MTSGTKKKGRGSRGPTATQAVHDRVSELVAGGARPTEAIRQVAGEMDRTVASTSSAYYSWQRRERARPSGPDAVAHPREAARRDPVGLYREMQPLVEAGASAEQAARRFGGDDRDVEAVAAGFEAWRQRQDGEASEDPAAEASDALLREAQERLSALEAENRTLRGELGRARQAIGRAGAILGAADDAGGLL